MKYIFVTGGVVSSLGKGLTAASLGALLEARGLRVRIQKFDPQYRPLAQFAVPSWDTQSVVNKPYLALDPEGRILYTEPEKNRFVVLNRDGQQEGSKGAMGSDPSSFNTPSGITVSPQGEVLVGDSRNARVVKYQNWR